MVLLMVFSPGNLSYLPVAGSRTALTYPATFAVSHVTGVTLGGGGGGVSLSTQDAGYPVAVLGPTYVAHAMFAS